MRWTWAWTWVAATAGTGAALTLADPAETAASPVETLGGRADDPSPAPPAPILVGRARRAAAPACVREAVLFPVEGGAASGVDPSTARGGPETAVAWEQAPPDARRRAEEAHRALLEAAAVRTTAEPPAAAPTEGDLRFGLRQAWRDMERAERLRGPAADAWIDRARRALSAALFLPEMFDAGTGAATPARDAVRATVDALSRRLLADPESPIGLTVPRHVAPGETPWGIVERSPYGPNAVLFWNRAGDLDPRRLRAGQTLAAPVEPVSVRVDRAHRLVSVLLGGVVVREFAGLAVTKPGCEIPSGRYRTRCANEAAPYVQVEGDGVGFAFVGEPDAAKVSAARAVAMDRADALETVWWVSSWHGGAREVDVR
jgi:hypothetical protein